jgi:guanylate kinase
VLVILFGPAGVGKTSITRSLVRDAGYHALMTYTTRKPRIEEDDRKSLTDASYDADVASKQIVSTSQVFGHRYGLSRAQLAEALSDLEKVYLVDFALENIQDIASFSGHKLGILVMPPSEDELRQRLIGRGHESRVEPSLAQLHYCQDMQISGLPVLIGDRVVVNRSLRETAAEIQRLVETSTFRAGGSVSRATSFLTDSQIEEALRAGEIFERGTWSTSSVHQASYGLRIDSIAHVSTGSSESVTGERRYEVMHAIDGHFELAPGDSALLQSVERFDLSPGILGIVIPRGLLVANSLAPGSSYVDPGFKGYFTIPVTNVSGRIIRLPAGMEAARVLFAELEHVVGKPWSSADATSLRSELAALPGRLPISVSALRELKDDALLTRIRGEAPLGPETAEALERTRRGVILGVAFALVWPIALLLANTPQVQAYFAKVFSDSAAFVSNIAAGLATSLILFIISRYVRYRRRASGPESRD